MNSEKLAGREQALAEEVERHRGRLRAFIGGLVRDQVEAEDVLQDVFAEFTESFDLGETIESWGAWLARVARNKVIDRFRRRRTQKSYEDGEGLATEEGVEDGNDWLRDRVREEIVVALEGLPAEQRDVFVMHELEGKSFEEIARETGVGVNTLLSRKRYAIQALREKLKEIYDELE